ncbi:hemin receptor [Sphingomonas sp. Root710]|nr:hemin receptor [Sphingomonas sp. Root710]
MTPDQIALVKSTFVYAIPISDAVATDFYDRLFAQCPHLRAMFAKDMAAQRQKLMLTLTAIVTDLDNLDRLVPMVTELARRHVGYGVRDEHYAPVATALIETLRQALGARFTPAVEAAWGAAYGVLSNAMIQAVRMAA